MAGAEQFRLKEYLLDQLTEDEEEQVEERLLSEPEFVDEHDTVVDELVDDYVAGRLNAEDVRRMKDVFFRSSERKDKLKFALALKQYKLDRAAKHLRLKRFFKLCTTIAACLLVVFGGLYVGREWSGGRDVDKGLAALQAAFRLERPLEARLSNFAYAPVANQRGGPTKIDYIQRDRAAGLLLNAVSEHPSAASHHALGKYYLAERQLDKAIDQLKTAVELDPNNATIRSDLGAALLEEGKAQISETDKGKGLEILARSLEQFAKALQLDNSLLEAYFNRALVSQYLMPSEQAAAAWRDYLQRDSSSLWAEEARRNLKLLEENAQRTSWNTRDAIESFLEARHAGDDDAAWKVLAQSYTSAGNEVTNRLLDSLLGLEAASQAIEPESALQDLIYVAKLELQRSEDRYTSDLIGYYQNANPKQRSLLVNARWHMKAGYAFFAQSRFGDAIGEYTHARLLYEKADDATGKALVDYRLDHCYVLLNELEKAKSGFQQLSDRCEISEYRWLIAQSSYGMAHANASDNQYSRAIEYSEQALTRFERAGDLNGVLKCLAQLADLNQSLNRNERSLGYLGRGLTLAGEIHAEPMQRWAIMVQLALSMASMQLHEAELFYYKEALSIALQMGRPLIISRSYGYLGSAYATLKMYSEALSEATKAFETGRSVSEAGGLEIVANASLQLGDIHRLAGECVQALEAYDRSTELYQSLNLGYYSYVAHKGKLSCYLAGTDDGLVRQELQTVLGLSESYRSKITNESERVSFFNEEQSVFDLAIRFEFVRMKDPITAFKYSEISRARSLLDALHLRASVLKKSYGPDLNLPAVTSSLSLLELQEKMPEGAQILQYAVLDDRLILWVVTKLGIKNVEVNIGSQLLTQKVREYLAVVNTPPGTEHSEYLDRGKELYRILIAPAEPYLDRSKFLCLVPDKILHYLPYGALVSPATSKFLIEEYDVGVAPNSSIFVELSASAKRKDAPKEERLLSVGNPTFDKTAFSSLQTLPSAASEARAVAAFYPKNKLLLGNEATEAAIKAEIMGADVVHLAMHYVINENSAMLSGFPVVPQSSRTTEHGDSDGLLQSYEVYMMNLSRTRLVVLSACQTGIEQEYDGEGSISAARPFLVAGVPTVVASLWPVDSDASAQLMTKFHAHRIGNKLPVATALKQAQIDMAHGDDLNYRHPYYWASFLTIGGYAEY